jgi:hypothetical protein
LCISVVQQQIIAAAKKNYSPQRREDAEETFKISFAAKNAKSAKKGVILVF